MPLNPPIADWRGKRVWIIGASTGIGRAMAQTLHERGARVIVSARHADVLDVFVAQHPGSQNHPLDVTDKEDVARAAQALQADEPLDMVCYAAGYYRPMRADQMDLDELLHHQQINLTGALYVIAAVIPGMLAAAKQGHTPHLSLVGSVAGLRGLPQSLAYGPTKAALIHLAEILFLDLRPKGIGVSVINPGFVSTPLTAINDFYMPALLTPQQAVNAMIEGWGRGDFDIHFPKRLTFWLKLLRMLPYRWYFALVHRVTRM